MTIQEQMTDALKGKTIADILADEKFGYNLGKYWDAQRADRKAAEDSAKAIKAKLRGFKIPAHPIDHFKDWTVQMLTDEYGKVLEHKSNLSANDRKYLCQLCGQAYNLTIIEIAGEKYPEVLTLINKKQDEKQVRNNG